jgi:hypothetical protein
VFVGRAAREARSSNLELGNHVSILLKIVEKWSGDDERESGGR